MPDAAPLPPDAPAPTDALVPSDDLALPFAVPALDARGRVVRLGASIDRVLARHAYPAPVARLVGEAAALAALLATSLKIDGRFQLQARTDGPVSLLVVDVDHEARYRATARYDAAKVAAAAKDAQGAALGAALLGSGHLALTVEGPEEAGGARYQGVVPLEGEGLEAAAHAYFRQSEQIPTRLRLAVGEVVTGRGAHWRAGGLLAQFLPAAPPRARDLDPGDAPSGARPEEAPEDDRWVEARALVDTIEDHELTDPTLPAEGLLHRLFHERGARLYAPLALSEGCRCSRERVGEMLASFPPDDRAHMAGDDGMIGVTCEFCSTPYRFAPAEVEALVAAREGAEQASAGA